MVSVPPVVTDRAAGAVNSISLAAIVTETWPLCVSPPSEV